MIFHCDICGVRRLDRTEGNFLHAVTRLTLMEWSGRAPAPPASKATGAEQLVVALKWL